MEDNGDFFATLDVDSNDVIDKNEAAAFFAAMLDGGLMEEAQAKSTASGTKKRRDRDEL